MLSDVKLGDYIVINSEWSPQFIRIEKVVATDAHSVSVGSGTFDRTTGHKFGSVPRGMCPIARKATDAEVMAHRCRKARSYLDRLIITPGNIEAVEALLDKYQ